MNESHRLEFFFKELRSLSCGQRVAKKMSGRNVTDSKSHFRKITLIQGGGWSLVEKELGSIPGDSKEDNYMYLNYTQGGHLYEVLGEG